MALPFARMLPILRGISELSGEETRDVDGADLLNWLAERGQEWSTVGFNNAFKALYGEGFVTYAPRAGGDVKAIRLGPRGREIVEGWPSAPGLDAQALTNAILTALSAQADDPGTPPERRKWLRDAVASAGNAAIGAAVKTATGDLLG